MTQIIPYLKAMPKCGLDLRSALTNGKVEVILKTFLGIAWVGSAPMRKRSYLMDKKLHQPLDFLAFEGGKPKFWVEAKCDFAAHPSSVQASARDAVRQVRAYLPGLRRELQECAGYIVHFLCPLPDDGNYPEWVDVYEPLLENKEYMPARLKAYYRDQGVIGSIKTLSIDFEPRIDVVVVEG